MSAACADSISTMYPMSPCADRALSQQSGCMLCKSNTHDMKFLSLLVVQNISYTAIKVKCIVVYGVREIG